MNTDSVLNYRILKHAAFIEQYVALRFFWYRLYHFDEGIKEM